MKRTGLILSLALGLLTAPVSAEAQQAAKTARAGWVALSPGPTAAQLQVFRRAPVLTPPDRAGEVDPALRLG